MILEELVVHNFGGYRGRHAIELTPPSPERPVVLFGGMNGAGKTTLLDALQLVLYGRRAGCTARVSAGYEEYLRRSIHRAVAGREGAAVELAFVTPVDGEPVRFRVHRSWEATVRSVREHLAVHRDDIFDPVATEQWPELVEELIPLDISSLFFFDGEKIEALADPERAARVIETAVESLLGLNLLDRLQSDLVALERRRRAAAADADAREELGRLQAEVEATRVERAHALQEQASRRNEVDRVARERATAEEQFRREGGELFERKSEIEQRKAAIRERLARNHHELAEIAAGSLPLRLVRTLLTQLVEQNEVEENAERAAVLAEVLVERDATVVKSLKDELPASALAALKKELSSDRRKRAKQAATARYLSLGEEGQQRLGFLWPIELDRVAAAAAKLLAEGRALHVELDAIDRELAAVPSPDAIEAIVRSRDEAIRVLNEAEVRLTVADEAVRIADRQWEAAETRLQHALRDVAGSLAAHEDADRIVRHAEKVRATVSLFREALLERHLSRIEAAVLDSFRRVLRKQRLVSDLRLDPVTFELSLFDRTGEPIAPERLSAGERQLLAVALLWGLARVSGKRLPMVIDTPLGRLDSSHRRLLVERYFPVAGHQVLLLSTDQEIDEELARALEPAVGRTYELRHDDASGSTTIVDGYFWDVSNVA